MQKRQYEDADTDKPRPSQTGTWTAYRVTLLDEIEILLDRLDCSAFIDAEILACVATKVMERVRYIVVVERSAAKDAFPRSKPSELNPQKIGAPLEARRALKLVCDYRRDLLWAVDNARAAFKSRSDLPRPVANTLVASATHLQIIAMMMALQTDKMIGLDRHGYLPFLSANGRIALTHLDIVGGNRELVEQLTVHPAQCDFVCSARYIMDSSNVAVINALLPKHDGINNAGRYELTPIGIASFDFGPRNGMYYPAYGRSTASEIENFMIDRRFQDAGYGNDAFGTIVRYVCKKVVAITNPAHGIMLHISPRNERARKLYEAHGFEAIQTGGDPVTGMALYDPLETQPNVFDANELMPEQPMSISAVEDATVILQAMSCEVCKRRIDAAVGESGIAVNRADPTMMTRAGVCSRACFDKLN